ncbi:hypothetical protein BDQ12DRAFT_94635 [Crucibulum laeve]|uniref:Uncharacterized protein n=1 Tax=Crucibulum laeve TaxID=68775 RepID=A0A5C3LZR7_9AGAR|nr:hypothetical protein BDQ12DRAFT_94635 [Crucibulum laeve]
MTILSEQARSRTVVLPPKQCAHRDQGFQTLGIKPHTLPETFRCLTRVIYGEYFRYSRSIHTQNAPSKYLSDRCMGRDLNPRYTQNFKFLVEHNNFLIIAAYHYQIKYMHHRIAGFAESFVRGLERSKSLIGYDYRRDCTRLLTLCGRMFVGG